MLSWRDLNAQRVSRQSLDSIMTFFSEYEKENKKGYITIRFLDIGEATNLASGTVTRGIKDLEDSGIIEVIPNKGNNQPKNYMFKKRRTKLRTNDI